MTALSKPTLTPDSICHVAALRHVSLPAGSHVVQGLLTNRPHAVLQTMHCASGIRTNRTNRIQTILQTVHAAQGFRTNRTNRSLGGSNFHPPNRNGLYSLYERRARFVGRFVHGLYGLYEFLKGGARFV